jgi:hypothetical protein
MTGRFPVLEVSVPYRLQREPAALHPAQVQEPAAVPDRPPARLSPVEQLQQTAGNAAVVRLV